jgi:bifunctional non-homologous end joining protein LigD
MNDIARKLAPLISERCPFPTHLETLSPAHWVLPKLSCEIRFTAWTTGGRIRHPVFLGLR